MSYCKLFVLLASLCFPLLLEAQPTALDSAKRWTRQAEKLIRRNPDSSIVLLQQAASIFRDQEAYESLCRVYNGLSYVYNAAYDYRFAERYALKAVALGDSSLGDSHPLYINALTNLGATYRQIGALEKARQANEAAIQQAQASQKPSAITLSRLYNNQGILLRRMGDASKALQYYQEAFRHLHSSPKARPSQLFSLSLAQSRAYDDLGDRDQARQMLYQSQAFLEEAPDPKSYRRHIQYMHRLARLHYEDAQYDSTRFYLQAADLIRAEFGPYREQVSLEIRADLAQQAKHWDEAQSLLHQARVLREQEFGDLIKSPSMAQSHQQLGDLFVQMGERDSAAHHYHRAIWYLSDIETMSLPSLNQVLQIRETLFALEGLLAVYRLQYQQNANPQSWTAGIAVAQLADSCIQALRRSHAEDQAKLRLGERGHRIYEQAIALIYERYQHDPQPDLLEQALAFAEGSKAMVLFESQQQMQALHQSGLPDSLTEREAQLKAEIAFCRNRLISQSKASSEQQAEWQEQLFALQQEEEQLQKNLEQSYPRYFAMRYQSLPAYQLKRLQSGIEEGKMLLSYFWGEDQVYLWALSRQEAKFLRLTDRQELERSLRAFAKVLQTPNYEQAHFRTYTDQAYRLFQMLLGETNLGSYQSLEIIPDGPLAAFPWEALLYEPIPEPQGVNWESARLFRDLPYVFQRWAIAYGFSLRLQMEDTYQPEARANFAAFAPNYTDSLALQYNQASAEKLHALLGGELYLGAEANETRFRKEAADFQILHLAMHGRIDPLVPSKTQLELSHQDSLHDGLLHLYELYDLGFAAELVVLAACESAGGDWIDGEGVMSLSRAFRYAGCPSLVASLWEADGRVADQMLIGFYEGLDKGLDKQKALQQARGHFLQRCSPQLTHPFYWSSFVLTGNTDPIDSGASLWY
ncbi:MAG: CHAT domain-containing tetratricopeptide repeat protein, partial [Bacteroidota bacterium]